MNDILRRTWAEIDLDALANNYHKIKAMANGKTVIAVVKANAYGHGDVRISKHLESIGVTHFAVSNIWEAESLVSGGITGEILIFGYTDFAHIKLYHNHNLTYIVGSLAYAKALNKLGEELGKKIRVHIKIDSGMTRIGIDSEDEINEILSLAWLNCTGAFTHFAVADSTKPDDIAFTKQQYQRFMQIASGKGLLLHSQNSGGILLHPEFEGDFVRAGIILYGQKPSEEIELSGFKPVLTFKSIVSQIKVVKDGSFISYGRRYQTHGEQRIAVIPVGYADGYSRGLSNKGFVEINGCTVPIVGTVCMDLLMVDVTDIKADVGDEVVLYSSDISNEHKATADAVAKLLGTINYELLCAIAMRVPRVYYQHGEIVDVVKYI